jgi:hypothetical protein
MDIGVELLLFTRRLAAESEGLGGRLAAIPPKRDYR